MRLPLRTAFLLFWLLSPAFPTDLPASAQAPAQTQPPPTQADAETASTEILRVEVSGVDGEALRNVQSLLGLQREVQLLQAEPDTAPQGDSLQSDSLQSDTVSGERLRQLFEAGYDEILTALQPFGYYQVHVEGSLQREQTTWVARYQIEPGPRMPLTEVDLLLLGDGADDPDFRQLVAELPLTEGEPLSHPAYEAAKSRLLGRAAERGYLQAKFTVSELRIDLQGYQASAFLRFYTGPRFLLGDVTFRQYEAEAPLAARQDGDTPYEEPQEQEILKPEVLQRLVPFLPGDPYDTELLIRLERDLSSSAYFDNVTILPLLDSIEDLRVPIEVRLTAGRRSIYSGGIGYGTDTGGRLTFDLDYRRLNRRGHHGDLRVRVSELEQSVGARYIVPLGSVRRTDTDDLLGGLASHKARSHTLTYSAGYFDLKPDTSDSQTARIGAALSRSRGAWQEVLSLDLERTDFEVGRDPVGVDSGRTDLLIPGIAWTWVESDDRLFSSRGWRVQLQVRGADDHVLSTASFLRLYGEGKLILPLGDRLRLLLRGEGGTLLISDFRELPPALRFFTGGDRSIRGFGYRDLGDRDEEGNLIGGKNLAVVSAEVEARIWRDWGAAVFYDAGNALDHPFESPERGAGIGARWFSPVGPFRLDVAWALTREDTPVRVHIGFGIDL